LSRLRVRRMESEDIEYSLRGNTLRVYYYMLSKGGSLGVRELQRALGFKSPSAALYHLRKLVEMGLVERSEDGEYRVVREVKVGVLKYFVKLGRLRLPRFLVYAVFSTSFLVSYVILYPQTLSPHNLIALIVGIVSTAVLWYEAYRAYRELP